MFSRSFIYLFFVTGFITSCRSVPRYALEPGAEFPTDYHYNDSWAALPFTRDAADSVPLQEWDDVQSISAVDVFFIHPTSYIGYRGDKYWNASVTNEKVNERTDRAPIKYQASLFNGVGRVYAPRYRQAHLKSFYTKDTAAALQAFEIAYRDVKESFQFYLDHFNAGRPFIIASHSQGTLHAARLVKEMIDGKPLQEQLIAAYLVGYAMVPSQFDFIPPCKKPDETGCFCSWRTTKEGFVPKHFHIPGRKVVVTNPITWDESLPGGEKSLHCGAILRDFKRLYPSLVHAHIENDLLWVNKPKFPGSFLFTRRNYHIADYNFFYADIRRNASLRSHSYMQKHP